MRKPNNPLLARLRQHVARCIAEGAPVIVEITPGQAAYEADVAARPTYDGGAPRKSWAELGAVERESWERNPTPRFNKGGEGKGRL